MPEFRFMMPGTAPTAEHILELQRYLADLQAQLEAAEFERLTVTGTLDLSGHAPDKSVLLPSAYHGLAANLILLGCNDMLYYATARGIGVTASRGPDGGSLANMFTLSRNNVALWNNVSSDNPVTITIDLTPVWSNGPYVKVIGLAFGDRDCAAVDYSIRLYHDNDNDGTYVWETIATVTGNTAYELMHTVLRWRVKTIEITVTKAGTADRVGTLRIASIIATSPINGKPTGHLLDVGGDTVYGDLAVTGKLTDSVACGCRVIRNTTQSISSGVNTALSWNTEIVDTDNCWSSGNPTRLVAARSGYYIIGGNWTIDSVPAGRVITSIRRNGQTQTLAAHEIDPTTTTYQQISIATGMVWMSAGDYAEIYVYSSGGAVTVAAADVNNQHKNLGWIARMG